MQSDKLQISNSSTSLAALGGLVGRYSNPEFSIAPGGHVQSISAGYYTVTGLSRHVRLGEFVAHKSSTGVHLGEVVKVEQDIVVVCPIEPGDPIGIHDTVIRKGAFRIGADRKLVRPHHQFAGRADRWTRSAAAGRYPPADLQHRTALDDPQARRARLSHRRAGHRHFFAALPWPASRRLRRFRRWQIHLAVHARARRCLRQGRHRAGRRTWP